MAEIIKRKDMFDDNIYKLEIGTLVQSKQNKNYCGIVSYVKQEKVVITFDGNVFFPDMFKCFNKVPTGTVLEIIQKN